MEVQKRLSQCIVFIIYERFSGKKKKRQMDCLESSWERLELLKQIKKKKKNSTGDFPGGLVVKVLPSNAADAGSMPGWGAKTPHISRP